MATSEATQAQQNDEQAIRQLVDHWLDATKRGALETLLSLIADDVVLMVPVRSLSVKKRSLLTHAA